MSDLLHRAAEQRAKLYRARADRPSQRRSADIPGARALVSFPAQMRAGMYGAPDSTQPYSGMTPSGGFWSGDDGGAFSVGDLYYTGLASSVNSPYEMFDAAGPYEELVAPGAFKQSLALGDQLDVPLVIQHTDIRRIARTTIPAGQPGHLELAESQLGLVCRALLDPNDPDVQYIVPKIQSGLVTEMSFRFVIDAGEWSSDFSQYTIYSANLQRGDVSICGYGANPNTFGATFQAGIARSAYSEQAERNLLAQLKAKHEPTVTQVPRSFLVRDDDLR